MPRHKMSDSVTMKDIEDMRFERSEDMCEFAEKLGYRGVADQLQCDNGAYVSSFLAFLDDNPGACLAIYEWWENESGRDHDGNEVPDGDEEDDDEPEEEEEDDTEEGA